MDYYVYIHRKATDKSIFYVGKGSKRRAWGRNRSDHWHRVVNKHGLIVEIYRTGLQEWYAYELEAELILLHGLMRDGGALVNRVYNNAQLFQSLNIKRGLPTVQEKSEEHRDKISTSLKKYFKAHQCVHKGVPKSVESKQKMSESKIGKYTKGSNAFAKKVKCIEADIIFNSVSEAIEWLWSLGHRTANRQTLSRKRNETYKGFHWEYL